MTSLNSAEDCRRRRMLLRATLALPFAALAPSVAQAGKQHMRVAVTSIHLPVDAPDRLAYSCNKILRAIRLAGENNVDLLLLPELALGGFGGGHDSWWGFAARSPEYTRALTRVGEAVLAAGVATFFGGSAVSGNQIFNALYFADPVKRTMFPIRYKTSRSQGLLGSNSFTSGSSAIPLITSNGVGVAPVICAEILNPDITRQIRASPAKILVLPSSWWDGPRAGSDSRDAALSEFSANNRFSLLSNIRWPGRSYRCSIACNGSVVWDQRPEQDLMAIAELKLMPASVLSVSTHAIT